MTLFLPAAPSSLGPRATFLSADERPASVALLLQLTVILACTCGGWIDYDGDLNGVALVIASSWTASTFLSALNLRAVGNLVRLTCMLVAMSMAAPLASAALARVSAPLADGTLMRLDGALLGRPIWPDVIHLYGGCGALLHILSYAYVSLFWQVIALVVIFCLLDREADAWRFATAWGTSLLLCVAIFPLCPALGAYVHLHIDPSAVPDVLYQTAWHYPATLQSFKGGALHVLNGDALEGMISMPSFHACASVLLAWSFSRLPVLSWAMGALDALMWISAVPIGGHYAVDVVAGTAVAASAIFVSGKLGPGTRPARPGASRPRRPIRPVGPEAAGA